jgi:hypothetical protein
VPVPLANQKIGFLIDDLVPKFQALESEAVLARFQAVYEIGISDEVKEQVTKSLFSTFW